jgi:hypothetical protein
MKEESESGARSTKKNEKGEMEMRQRVGMKK